MRIVQLFNVQKMLCLPLNWMCIGIQDLFVLDTRVMPIDYLY